MRRRTKTLSTVLAMSLLAASAADAVPRQAGIRAAEDPAPTQADVVVQQPVAPEQDANIRFDFRDIDIRTLVEFMAFLSDRIVILPDQLQGVVTVSSPGPLTLDGAFRVVSALLNARQYTMLRDDQFLRVLHKSESVQAPLDIFYGSTVEEVPLEDRMITQIIPVENTDAGAIIDSLRPLVSASGNLFLSRDNNMIVVTETGTNVRRLLRMVNLLDERRPVARTTDTMVYEVKYMKAAEIAGALDAMFGLGAGLPPERTARITPVEAVNSLVITADLATHPEIGETIAALDVRRRQVLIEVRIVEGTLSDEVATGVNLLEFLLNSSGAQHTVRGGSGVQDPFISWNIASAELDLVLSAAAKSDTIRILSAPKVLTSDNQQANITVAQEEPIVRSVTDLSTTTVQPRTVVDFIYRDIGIELTVTPHITADRDVALDVNFSISALLAEKLLVSNDSGGITAPRIGKRSGQSNVTVMDGSTLVIGGLLKDDYRDQKQKVPVLGDIPLLGKLFSSTQQVKDQTELLIFITPRVATDDAEGRALTEEEAQSMSDELQQLRRPEQQGDEIGARREGGR